MTPPAGSGATAGSGQLPGDGIPDEAPVYVISVAAELAGLHPQTLRQYDRMGIVRPRRAGGRYRLYSMRDVRRLRQVTSLTAEGLNLVGIKRVLDLEERVAELEGRLARFEADSASTALVVWRPQRRRS
ncbi:MAG: heat shock protein transcriptional repressor HspR [Candidatus Nanopelagicales bacterium]